MEHNMESKMKLNIMKEELESAIVNEEFYLCYQPLIDTKTKKMVSMEALIRWKHPRKGVISPLDFIPLAESTNLIISIGEWVLHNACRQLKAWYEMGHSGYGISVNVSPAQLQQNDFHKTVARILAETEVLPEYLELEITESVFLKSTQAAINNLSTLRCLGVKLSIDDFGTGYNSLLYIQKLVINNIKLDRSFIFNIKADVNRAIIETVITLGHKINAEIIAEGVETKDQYEFLKKKGCDKIQGYYFSKPLLPENMTKFMKENSIYNKKVKISSRISAIRLWRNQDEKFSCRKKIF